MATHIRSALRESVPKENVKRTWVYRGVCSSGDDALTRGCKGIGTGHSCLSWTISGWDHLDSEVVWN